MSRIFKQKEMTKEPKLFNLASPPTKLVYSENKPARITLENNNEVISSCLQCPDTPCLKYNTDEIENYTFPTFPQDNTLNVCPTEAISLDGKDGFPTIEEDRCISCGVCASRCPYGAIYLDTENVTAVVNTAPNEHVLDISNDYPKEELLQSVEENHNKFRSLPKEGSFREETNDSIEQIYNKLNNIKVDAQFPNLLARNLLLQLGISCSIRRKGDVNLRMDGVLGPPGVEYGVLEVEIPSVGILDSPRNMLDNIAVLSSRYDLEVDKTIPLIVSLSLPNSRTEFWRVIKDIKNVLNIEINTLTIGALMLLLWNNKQLDLTSSSFYVDFENMSIREQLTYLIGRELNVSIGFNSILEPDK